MQQRNFYLVADYIENGTNKNGWYILQAADEMNAVNWLLQELETSGGDVQAIASVYGVNSMQELEEISENGLRPGVCCMLYAYSDSVFEERSQTECTK